MMSVPQATLLALVLCSALATVVLRDVLAAIVAFAAYSLGLALLWLTLRAPDVALTEAAVGAGVMTVLFLVTLTKTVRPTRERRFVTPNLPAAAVAIGFVAVLLLTVPAMPEIGSASAPAWSNSDVTQFYLDHAYKDTGVENAVTAVLAAYRGFDTLGEAVVVFTAGVAVLVVINEEGFT